VIQRLRYPTMSLRDEIADFLGRKRIAVVGVSTEAPSFSRGLFNEFVKRGYDVIPVNPKADEIEGRRAYASRCARSIRGPKQFSS
jgi:predicted CoA-binding protein